MGNIDLLQGTLDMLILRVLERGEMHGWGIAERIARLSAKDLQVGEGSLYPSLYRMHNKGWIESEWGESENKRRAKYYRLTPLGRRQLKSETEDWNRLVVAVGRIMA